jgi:hypothetical protein
LGEASAPGARENISRAPASTDLNDKCMVSSFLQNHFIIHYLYG